MSCGGACAPLIRSPTTLISNEALRLAQCRSGRRSRRRRGGGCGAPGRSVRTRASRSIQYLYYFECRGLRKCTPNAHQKRVDECTCPRPGRTAGDAACTTTEHRSRRIPNNPQRSAPPATGRSTAPSLVGSPSPRSPSPRSPSPRPHRLGSSLHRRGHRYSVSFRVCTRRALDLATSFRIPSMNISTTAAAPPSEALPSSGAVLGA